MIKNVRSKPERDFLLAESSKDSLNRRRRAFDFGAQTERAASGQFLVEFVLSQLSPYKGSDKPNNRFVFRVFAGNNQLIRRPFSLHIDGCMSTV